MYYKHTLEALLSAFNDPNRFLHLAHINPPEVSGNLPNMCFTVQ